MAIRHKGQTLVRILPKKRIAVGDSLLKLRYADVHTVTGYVLVLLEDVQQGTVAAADVYHMGAFLDHRQDCAVLLFLRRGHIGLSVTEESADKTRQIVYMGKERVVPGTDIKMTVCDGLVVAEERLDYIARLPFRKEHIARKRDNERLAGDARTCRRQRTIWRGSIEEVHRARYVEIAVGVKTLEELVRLIRKIAFDLEEGPEIASPAVLKFVRLLEPVALKFALELLLEEFSRKVCDVRKLTGCGKALLGSQTVPDIVVVAPVPCGIVRDCAAPYDIERKRLRVERSGGCDDACAIHLTGTASDPVHHLHATEAAADETSQMLDPALREEHAVDVNRIGEIVSRELAPVRLARIRVDGGRSRGAAASAKNVGANDMVAVCVDGATGTYHPFPPSARLRFAGAHACDMCVTRQRMAYEYDIIKLRTYCATLLIGNIHTF